MKSHDYNYTTTQHSIETKFRAIFSGKKWTWLLEVSFGTFQLIAQRNNRRFRCSVSIRSRTCSTRSEMLPVSSRKCRHRLVCWICGSDLEVCSGTVLAQGSPESESEASLSGMTLSKNECRQKLCDCKKHSKTLTFTQHFQLYIVKLWSSWTRLSHD